MLRIYLARHGQNIDNANGILNGHRDLELTELGIDQAKEAAVKIKSTDIKFDAVYTSPMIRAKRTAEIISSLSHNPQPQIFDKLIERDFGIMTGVLQNKITEMCAPDIIQTDKVTYFLNPEGAETFPDLINRAQSLIADIRSKHQDGNILLVTHGDLGKMIYAAYYNLDWQDVLMMFNFGNSELLQLSPDTSPDQAHVFKIQQHNS